MFTKRFFGEPGTVLPLHCCKKPRFGTFIFKSVLFKASQNWSLSFWPTTRHFRMQFASDGQKGVPSEAETTVMSAKNPFWSLKSCWCIDKHNVFLNKVKNKTAVDHHRSSVLKHKFKINLESSRESDELQTTSSSWEYKFNRQQKWWDEKKNKCCISKLKQRAKIGHFH